MLRGQAELEAQAEHEQIKRALGLEEQEAVSVGYSDLLLHGHTV